MNENSCFMQHTLSNLALFILQINNNTLIILLFLFIAPAVFFTVVERALHFLTKYKKTKLIAFGDKYIRA